MFVVLIRVPSSWWGSGDVDAVGEITEFECKFFVLLAGIRVVTTVMGPTRVRAFSANFVFLLR